MSSESQSPRWRYSLILRRSWRFLRDFLEWCSALRNGCFGLRMTSPITSIVFIMAFSFHQAVSVNDANRCYSKNHLESSNYLTPHPAKVFNFFQTKQKEPEHHSFSTRLATSFNPTPANARSTSENSAAKMPAKTNVPSRLSRFAIRRRSAMSRLEIKFAQTTLYCRAGFNGNFVTSPRTGLSLASTLFLRVFSRATRT